MVVLHKVGQVEIVAEQNGPVVPSGRHQWQYAVQTPEGLTEFTPSRLEAGRVFDKKLKERS